MLTHEVRRVVTWHENSGTERRVFRDHDKALAYARMYEDMGYPVAYREELWECDTFKFTSLLLHTFDVYKSGEIGE